MLFDYTWHTFAEMRCFSALLPHTMHTWTQPDPFSCTFLETKSKWVTWSIWSKSNWTRATSFTWGWFVPDRGWQEAQWTLSSVCQSPLPVGCLAGFSVAWVSSKQMFEQRINGLAAILDLKLASCNSQRVSQLAGVLLRSQQRNCSLQLGRWRRGKCMIYRNILVLFKSECFS